MKKFISTIIVCLLFVYLILKIINNIDALQTLTFHTSPLKMLILVLSVISIYLSNIFSWHLITKSLKTKLTLKKNLYIWMISNLSRLIPGGIWQYPGRVLLMVNKKIKKSTAISAVTLEGLLTVSMGTMVFMMSLSFWRLPKSYEVYQQYLLFTLFSPIFIFVIFNKKFMRLIKKQLAKITPKARLLNKIPSIGKEWIIPLSIAFIMRFICIGTALFLLLIIFLPLQLAALPAIIGIYAISWLIGYLAVFAPGGLGVTEGVLAALLSIYMSTGQAALFAILFRVVLFIGEAVFLASALTLESHRDKILTR